MERPWPFSGQGLVGRLIEPCGGERSVPVPLLLPISPIALVALTRFPDLFVDARKLFVEANDKARSAGAGLCEALASAGSSYRSCGMNNTDVRHAHDLGLY